MSTEPVLDPPQQQRREFVRAFAEHMWAHPGTDRPSIKPQTLFTITAACALIALLFGVIRQLIFPPAEPVRVVAVDPPRPSSFSAVSGWDCPTTATHGFEISGRTSAWYTVAEGGWVHDGCHGSFVAIPMSGDEAKADLTQSATWWFAPGPEFTACDVMVYVPRPEQPWESAAPAAQYFALAGRGGAWMAEMVVDQAGQQGRWVPVGRFPIGQNGLAITLVNRGKPAHQDDRIAVAQVRATCTNQ